MKLVGKGAMNEDILKGKWMQVKGKVKEEWGKLTDDDIDRLDGSREQLEGKIQEKYGWAKEEAQTHVDNWMKRWEEPANPNR